MRPSDSKEHLSDVETAIADLLREAESTLTDESSRSNWHEMRRNHHPTAPPHDSETIAGSDYPFTERYPTEVRPTSRGVTSRISNHSHDDRSVLPSDHGFMDRSRTSSSHSNYFPVHPTEYNSEGVQEYPPLNRHSSESWHQLHLTNYQNEIHALNRNPSTKTASSLASGSITRPLPQAPGLDSLVAGRVEAGTPGEPTSTLIDEDPFSEAPYLENGIPRSQLSYYGEKADDGPGEKNRPDLAGPAPQGAHARRGVRQAITSRKEVRLVNGELILECKIPSVLYSFLPRRDRMEFTHIRYTAVTCDPDEFVDRGYRLRQNFGKTTRETELFICVTMYNEDEILFTRTMHGIMRNIAFLCSRDKSRTWGKDGWQKIVVCVISDGRIKVHPRTLDALAAIGLYQDGIAKSRVNQRHVQAHVYEYTTQVSLDSDLKFKSAEKGIVPCQMIFCLKEKNQKKLNSHRWFFNAFGRALNPNVCVLLDVGTRPSPTALYHLWKAFDIDSNVAGAAGEIYASKGKRWMGLLNPLVASQNFEYKMSNILDKPLESVMGYIAVLPGALSAYRYHALQNDETGHGPLSQYFLGETLHGHDADVFTANMYLAEDRILCWELVAKRNSKWLLKFVSSAKGETDVPDSVPEFISQRRRWLNGAFFAAVYSLLHFRQLWRTDHGPWRLLLLHIEFVYQFINLVFTYLSLANFYLSFYFIAGSLSDPEIDPFGHGAGRIIFLIMRYMCVILICIQFILSMGNRPQGAKRMFFFSMVAYAVLMAYTTFAAVYILALHIKNSGSITIGSNIITTMGISVMSTFGLYFVMSLFYLDPWHMFSSILQYYALLPSYICTLQVYAFCNTHDVSWGTKGDNSQKTDLGAASGTEAIVELDMPSAQMDIDSGYDEALRSLRDRTRPESSDSAAGSSASSDSQAQEDYYRAVRTYMVTIWLFVNATLAMAVSESNPEPSSSQNSYLAFILWSVAALALIRAIGSFAFRIISGIHGLAEGRGWWRDRHDRKDSVFFQGRKRNRGLIEWLKYRFQISARRVRRT